MSVYDALDNIDGSDEVEAILETIENEKERISSIDDNVRILKNSAYDFSRNFKYKTIEEIQDFLTEVSGKLEDISDKLY